MTGDERTGPYYVILDVAISDVERYLTYMEQVTPALEAAGGRDYEGIKPIRDEVSTGRMIGVEGLRPGVPATQAPRPRAASG